MGPVAVWLQTIMDSARAAGVVVVAAAGNNGTSTPFYPAAIPSVIAVSATDRADDPATRDLKASWSNFGPWIDIAAPGTEIASTLPGGRYGSYTGTSMATPHVAGIAALAAAAHPGWTPASVEAALLGSASGPWEVRAGTISSGGGESTPGRAVASGAGPGPTPTPVSDATPYPARHPTSPDAPSSPRRARPRRPRRPPVPNEPRARARRRSRNRAPSHAEPSPAPQPTPSPRATGDAARTAASWTARPVGLRSRPAPVPPASGAAPAPGSLQRAGAGHLRRPRSTRQHADRGYVRAVIRYDAVRRRVTIDPRTSLAARTTYRIRLRVGIRDRAGNALLVRSFLFTTRR